MITIDKSLLIRESTALSGKTVQLLSTRKNITVFDWLTKSRLLKNVLSSKLVEKYKNTYGDDITAENISGIVTAQTEQSELVLIPITDINGFVNGAATETNKR
jgi:hypothetical protein